MKKILDFLQLLKDNNSKEWMDGHRKLYEEAKKLWLKEIEQMLKILSVYNSEFATIIPKNTITRINNNRRFQPDKPIYKDNFTFTPSCKMTEPSIHVSISPGNSFIGGGLYRPDNELLAKIREAIDYDGEVLNKIVTNKEFVDYFGGLDKSEPALKSAPKGYSSDHRNIELLRMKSFVVILPLKDELVLSDDFHSTVEKSYVLMQPMLDYLIKAINYIEE